MDINPKYKTMGRSDVYKREFPHDTNVAGLSCFGQYLLSLRNWRYLHASIVRNQWVMLNMLYSSVIDGGESVEHWRLKLKGI